MLKRLKSRLARFQWKMLAFALVFTAAAIWVGVDLLDGQIDIGRGTRTLTETPIQFAFWLLGGLGMVLFAAICWISVFHPIEEPLPRIRPEFDDPSKRRPL